MDEQYKDYYSGTPAEDVPHIRVNADPFGRSFQFRDDKTDRVNRPSHYTQGDIECIDAMEAAFGKEELKIFSKISAFKYLWRAGHKGHEEEDFKKAMFYCNKAAKLSSEISSGQTEQT